MPRFVNYALHRDNPQPRLLMHAAALINAGAVAALPTAAGYLLSCRLDDKTASAKLRWLAGVEARDAPVLLCRDVGQAAVYLRIDDVSFRAIRAHDEGSAAFPLPCTRRVPRRLALRGLALLYFAGNLVTQGLQKLIDEALLLSPIEGGVQSLDQLPPSWRDGIDMALDAGPLPGLVTRAQRPACEMDGSSLDISAELSAAAA